MRVAPVTATAGVLALVGLGMTAHLVAKGAVAGGWWWSLPLFLGFVVALVMVLGSVPLPWIRPNYTPRPGALLSAAAEEAAAGSELPLDAFRIIGSHNSCHVASCFSIFVPYWRYTHAPLRDLLDMGLRHLELDLWYARGPKQWIVRHEGLVDALTTNGTMSFSEVLRDIEQWSRKHPGHFPLIINLDIKGAYRPGLSWFAPILGRDLEGRECDREALDALQREAAAAWPSERLFTPADVTKGRSEPLGQVLRTTGWPPVRSLRGKCMLLLNLYGCRQPARHVADPRWWWIRCPCDGSADPNCAYSENGPVHRGLLYRASCWTGGETLARMGLSPQEAAKQRARFDNHCRVGVHLIIADHLALVPGPAVRLQETDQMPAASTDGGEASPLLAAP